MLELKLTLSCKIYNTGQLKCVQEDWQNKTPNHE